MSGKRTQVELSYGFRAPSDLVSKLKRERQQFSSPPSPDQIFNFMVTAHSLFEWTNKVFKNEVKTIGFAEKSGKWSIPVETLKFIEDPADAGMIPNPPSNEIRTYVLDCLSLTKHIANASKHYEWWEGVDDISEQPNISDFYHYVFTNVTPDVYVTVNEKHYGITQIASIVLQFYSGLLAQLEAMKRET